MKKEFLDLAKQGAVTGKLIVNGGTTALKNAIKNGESFDVPITSEDGQTDYGTATLISIENNGNGNYSAKTAEGINFDLTVSGKKWTFEANQQEFDENSEYTDALAKAGQLTSKVEVTGAELKEAANNTGTFTAKVTDATGKVVYGFGEFENLQVVDGTDNKFTAELNSDGVELFLDANGNVTFTALSYARQDLANDLGDDNVKTTLSVTAEQLTEAAQSESKSLNATVTGQNTEDYGNVLFTEITKTETGFTAKGADTLWVISTDNGEVAAEGTKVEATAEETVTEE